MNNDSLKQEQGTGFELKKNEIKPGFPQEYTLFQVTREQRHFPLLSSEPHIQIYIINLDRVVE